MTKTKLTALWLSAVLLVPLTGCASRQPAKEPETENQTFEQLSETEVLQRLYEAQVLREILTRHENAQENSVFFDAQGNVVSSVYCYADKEIMVWENDRSYLDIQYPDGYYTYDPDTMDKVVVGFGMEGIDEELWEERLDSVFGFSMDEDDAVTEITETDGRIHLTIISSIGVEHYPEALEDEFEPGITAVSRVEMDAETYIAYSMQTCLRKPDGTEIKAAESHYSYDVAPYEPSEEMLQVINGTDKTITLIADPGTQQEKTYVKSCGENGRLQLMLADGYEKIYKDEACTQESEPSDENGERTVYVAKGS